MRNKTLQTGLIAAFMLGAFAGTPGFAAKPDWTDGKGGGRSEQRDERPDQRRGDGDRNHGQRDQRSEDRRGDSGERDAVASRYFGDQHRSASRDYFRQHYSDTRCPPGLAKKQNGCMPPGLAKKWSMGRSLPRDVIFHNLPPELVNRFGTPPPRQRYVRVDSDILLIEMGTGIVLDVIENLGW